MSQPASSAGPTGTSYAGRRLGLPERGPGAVAGWGRRILALVVDWFASVLVAGAVFGPRVTSAGGWQGWMPMAVFLAEVSLFTALTGGSFGQQVVRVSVVRLDGGAVPLLYAVLRTLLICLVIPPLVFNRDQRGLHDLAAGTVTVRRR